MTAVAQISNDDRGWIMTALSGVACIFGASFICVDIVVRQFPGKRNWRIQDSDAFLSISLSLSFGVMLFSALYSMLPSAKTSLVKGGYSSREASWILIACFVGGVVGIQVISRVLHHFVPHNVVDCEHTHEDEEADKEGAETHDHADSHDHHDHTPHHTHSPLEPPTKARPGLGSKKRTSSLASRPQMQQRLSSRRSYLQSTHDNEMSQGSHSHIQTDSQPLPEQRPTLKSQITDTFTKLTSGQNPLCDCEGPCYGYSDLCQSDCFKRVNARGGFKAAKPSTGINRPSAIKSATATESTPLLHDIAEEPLTRPHTRAAAEIVDTHPSDAEPEPYSSERSSATCFSKADGQTDSHERHSVDTDDLSADQHDEQHAADQHHHHHVPKNAFLSIGLQTSIAIAIHKLPEGFITFATNHANPKLGVSVFLALFIHNITEGFAMALPLYLAINNRLKAMVISFVLGGLSQPLGAGVAALWFKLAGKSGWAPNEAGYGGMFAVTAGIMASVALQLFAESLDLTHSKKLCMIGAFVGMAILGVSSALTA